MLVRARTPELRVLEDLLCCSAGYRLLMLRACTTVSPLNCSPACRAAFPQTSKTSTALRPSQPLHTVRLLHCLETYLIRYRV